MEWSVGVGKAAATAADLLVVAVPEGRSGPDFSGLESLDRACDGGWARWPTVASSPDAGRRARCFRAGVARRRGCC